MTLGTLEIFTAKDRTGLVAKPTADFISSGIINVDAIGVASIDPQYAGTAEFCEHYQVPIEQAVNCVIVEGVRGETKTYAACMVFGSTRADVNGLVRKVMDARKASFAPMDYTLEQTGMEYGGITAVGLPTDWKIFIDSKVAAADLIVVGGGVRGSKLILPGKVLASLPNAVVLEDLGKSTHSS